MFDCILLICSFVFMLMLTINSDYYSDDFHFKFVWTDLYPTRDAKECNGIYDIIVSMKNYYMLSGGRVLCHVLAYIFVNLPKFVFNILNSLCFTFLIFIFCKNVSVCSDISKKPAVLISFFLLTFCVPFFGDNCIWISGSANYLWPTVLILSSLYSVSEYAKNPINKNLITASVLVFISSATNETTGGMLLIFMFITFVFEHKLSIRKQLLPYIMCIPPMLTVILAPGNSARQELQRKYDFIEPAPILDLLAAFVNRLFTDYYIIFIAVFFIVVYTLISRKSFFKAVVECKYIITGVCGMLVLLVSRTIPIRPAYIGFVIMLVGVLSLSFNFMTEFIKQTKEKETFKPFIKLCLKIGFVSMLICAVIKNFTCSYSISRIRFNTVNDILFGTAAIAIIYLLSVILPRIKLTRIFESAIFHSVIICLFLIIFSVNIINGFDNYLVKCSQYDNYIATVKPYLYNNDYEDYLITRSASFKIDYGQTSFFPHLSAYNIHSIFGLTWLAMNDGIYIDPDTFIDPGIYFHEKYELEQKQLHS